MSKAKQPDALTLFFDGLPPAQQPDLHRGHRGKRGVREGQPQVQDEAALKLWLMANSPAKALRVMQEYAAECVKECTADKEHRMAGVWQQFIQELEKVKVWTFDHSELC